MSKQRKIHVNKYDITILKENDQDYISLTDMIRAKDGDFFITDWLRNRNTLEFLSVWESLNNPKFNYGEFAIIKSKAGLNNFKISVKEWVERTSAIGIVSKPGRYGGTYAHQDIAFEFGTWISPVFKLYLIREFQRLKDFEAKTLNIEWDYRRFLSKVNYKIHTDSVRDYLLPLSKFPEDQKYLEYAEEADILNFALFNMTAKQWREKFRERASRGNIRDYADTHELTVLSNMESYNAEMINEGLSKRDRFVRLRNMAVRQMRALKDHYTIGTIDSPFVIEEQYSKGSTQHRSEFDKTLEGIMKVPKPEK